VVARRLIDGTDATVLLLEAGGPDDGRASLSNPPQWVENIGSAYDWTYRYEPSPHVDHRAISLSLGKVLGGSGSINAMVWARGKRADYDGWARAGNAGWDFHSVLPLFKKSEDWETARVSSAARAVRFASNAPEISIRLPPRSSRRASPMGCRISTT